MTLWIGQSASEIGSAITALALPLVVITVLDGGSLEVGVVQACTTLSFLVASVPAGIIVDRSRKRLVMLTCDFGRVAVLVTIPVLAAFDLLSLVQLSILAFLAGVLTVVFGIAYHSYYPIFVPAASLPEANAKIGSTEALARVSGPGLGGGLIALVGAIGAVLVDALTYLVSAVSLLFLRTPGDVARPSGKDVDLRAETSEGFRALRADEVLRKTALCTVSSVFCLSMTGAVLVYFLVRDLGLSAATVGLVFAVGEVGGLVAAILAARIMRKVGTARIMWVVVLAGPAGYLAAVATPGNAVVLTSVFMILSSARFVLFDIAQYSYRQLACPLDRLGKVNATIRLGVGSASALGALAGGWLGTAVNARTTIVIATTLLCAAGLWVVFSPLRSARDISELIPEGSPRPAELGTSTPAAS